MEEFLNLNILGVQDVALRLFLAALLGFFIGLDRDHKNKPVDFRAYMIVCVATCMVAMTGIELTAFQGPSFMQLDLSKIIEGTLTGIGFLGAGCIIQQSRSGMVIGTATGASIWASGGIGLAVGFGLYGLAIGAFLLVLLILVIIGRFMPPYYEGKDDRREPDENSDLRHG